MLRASRWSRRAIGCVCLAAALYTIQRALVLRVEYFDGYEYLIGARRLAGASWAQYNRLRPPLVSLLNVPAVLLARLGPPAGLAWVIGPHVTAAAISLLTALVVFRLYARSAGSRAALLGLAFLVTGRMFIRYSAMTMADMLSAGGAAATVLAFLGARARARWILYVLSGVALGAAMTSKFPLVVLAGVLVLSELLLSVRARSLSLPRVLGLLIALAVGALTFLAIMILAFRLGYGPPTFGQVQARLEEMRALLPTYLVGSGGESRWDFLDMTITTTGWPLIILAAFGIGLAVVRRSARDLPFLAWLLVLGGAIVGKMEHNEARYLLPLVPALLYFAARGADRLLSLIPWPRWAAAAALALVAVGAIGGVRQVWADRDPIFTRDFQRAASRALERGTEPGGRLVWIGGTTCLYPERQLPLPYDEYFDTFHFHAPFVEYFTGRPVVTLPSLDDARDGDALLVPGPNCPAPEPRVAPWRVFRARAGDAGQPVHLDVRHVPALEPGP